jgi:tRNA isopentenyltransferase (miaA)
VLLAGPTAVGKSALALALQARLADGATAWDGAELVSVDSAQVFRGMDIGTAKPDAALRARVPHHLLDLLDPAQSYSAARFVDDALAAIAQIRARRRVPILVGGTMLYFRALLRGLSPMPPADPELRARLTAEAAEHGWPALHARLMTLDAETAARLHENDAQRVQRALEVVMLTGRPLADAWDVRAAPDLGTVLAFGLQPLSREALHRSIGERFLAMMNAGFLDEVRALYARGDLDPALPAVRAVGYRQLWAHCEGRCDLPTAVERGIAATRQYAKRQLTWLRADSQFRALLAVEPEALTVVLDALGAADCTVRGRRPAT